MINKFKKIFCKKQEEPVIERSTAYTTIEFIIDTVGGNSLNNKYTNLECLFKEDSKDYLGHKVNFSNKKINCVMADSYTYEGFKMITFYSYSWNKHTKKFSIRLYEADGRIKLYFHSNKEEGDNIVVEDVFRAVHELLSAIRLSLLEQNDIDEENRIKEEEQNKIENKFINMFDS